MQQECGGGLLLLIAAVACSLVASVASSSSAQTQPPTQPPSQQLLLSASAASTATSDTTNIIQLDGPVTITMDRLKLTAKNAVVWLDPNRQAAAGTQLATIALLGDASLEQPEIKRSGDRLLVTAQVNGEIRITANTNQPANVLATPLYAEAYQLRQQSTAINAVAAPRATSEPIIAPPLFPTTLPTTYPTTQQSGRATTRPARFTLHARNIENTMADGKVAVILSEGVAITEQKPDGEYLELQATRAVVFTYLNSMREIGHMQQVKSIDEAIVAAYLEGDVRISNVPVVPGRGEQRLSANRVYYDFATDRAVLTDAVIHTVDIERNIPIIVRAKTVRQLSSGEYRASKAELSTSSFAVPSYSIKLDKVYIREEPTGDPRYGTRTTFDGSNITMRAFGVPFFWLPELAGSVTERGFILRNLELGNSKDFGFGVKTEWGLFETLGILPPNPDIDASYSLDYFSDRGPAFGLDGKYGADYVSKTTKKAVSFEGDLESYFVLDDGFDTLGHHRGHPDPDNYLRGRVAWEHQIFFPEDWTLQLRAGWMSDATFREEWFEDEYNDGLPLETSLYLKKQRDTEAITFLATAQPNNFVTNADFVQEQFEVERLPELGYHRIGDSLFNDHATFFSDNTLGRERFQVSGADLGEQGFSARKHALPGRPGLGLLGVTGLDGPPNVPQSIDNRGDFRQEIDWPIPVGQFKVMPYVVGKYTYYSESPVGGAQNRAFAGAGVRVNTQFWKIDNTPESDFFDIHRVRHIIEPEIHLWTSAQNVDSEKLYIYDELVDKQYDTSAVQFALRQRWQTKRGGPGNYRSVDFLSFNVEANFFSNKPSDADLAPTNFRGIFYPTLTEFSTPRDSVNMDAQWRISDNTIIQSDAQYNIDEQSLATAAIGLIAQRAERVTYFLGFRYIGELDSDIATIAFSYQLTPKYSIGLKQSFDFGSNSDVYSSVSFLRKFDRFFMLLSVYHDQNNNESGFSFGLFPEGLGKGASTDQLTNVFGGRGY